MSKHLLSIQNTQKIGLVSFLGPPETVGLTELKSSFFLSVVGGDVSAPHQSADVRRWK